MRADVIVLLQPSFYDDLVAPAHMPHIVALDIGNDMRLVENMRLVELSVISSLCVRVSNQVSTMGKGNVAI